MHIVHKMRIEHKIHIVSAISLPVRPTVQLHTPPILFIPPTKCSAFYLIALSLAYMFSVHVYSALIYVRCQFSLHHTWTKFGQCTKPSKCLTCLRIYNVEQTNETKFSSVFYWLLMMFTWLIAALPPSILILLSQTWFHKSSIVCERILTRGSTATRTRGE